MRTALCTDPLFLQHAEPPGHPERRARLEAVTAALDRSGLVERCVRLAPRRAELSELALAHDAQFVAALQAQIEGRSGFVDPDTYHSPASWSTALYAAGAAIDATRAALSGDVDAAFVLARPPGHHAESRRAMGFCLLNNIAVAAAVARAQGADRVAILDWDVHHGNGTQEIFWRDPNVLYLSVHQYPFYPGTGANAEIGEGEGRGTTLNVPLPAGMGPDEYDFVFDHIFMPALRAFAPALILVSAGYDAHVDDPLANMRLVEKSYAGFVHRLASLGKPLVALLEGGYDLHGVSASASATLDSLLHPAPCRQGVAQCAPPAEESCARTRAALTGTTLGLALADAA